MQKTLSFYFIKLTNTEFSIKITNPKKLRINILYSFLLKYVEKTLFKLRYTGYVGYFTSHWLM